MHEDMDHSATGNHSSDEHDATSQAILNSESSLLVPRLYTGRRVPSVNSVPSASHHPSSSSSVPSSSSSTSATPYHSNNASSVSFGRSVTINNQYRMASDSSTVVSRHVYSSTNTANMDAEKSYPEITIEPVSTMSIGTDTQSPAATISSGRSRRTSMRQYPPLTEEERKLAIMHRNSENKRSIVPIFFFLAASLGKLILGLGVSLAIKGHYASKKSDFGIGLGLAAAGLVAVIAAALGFGAAVSRINKRWGIIFKCFSIGGGLLLSIGYALKQYFVSDHKPMFSIRLSFIPLAMGTAAMGISLPNFTAYTELYRGRIVWFPIKHRPLIALLCLSPSMGILFGGWISAEVSHWPVAFNSVVLTFAVALGYAGVALFWSDNLRLKAMILESRLYLEEERAEEQARRVESDKIDNEKKEKEKAGQAYLGNSQAGGADLQRRPTGDSVYTTPTLAEFEEIKHLSKDV